MYTLNGDKGLKRGVNAPEIGVPKIIWSSGGSKTLSAPKYCVDKSNV